MKMKNATILLVIFVFFFNFLLVSGYLHYLLIPQLSKAIETNNEQLNQDMHQLIKSYQKQSDSLPQVSEQYAKERNLSIYLENTKGEVIYNNNKELWSLGNIYYVTSFLQIDEEVYIVKLYRKTDTTKIPALNNFILFEIIVILMIVLIIFETTNQRIISPIEKLQKSIQNYKFGIKPSRTTGHTEIDVIQNNFVDLVEDLEEEKEKQNRIIASISHDIKTPLTAIMGYSDRLITKELSEEKKKNYIEKIHNKSISLKELTEEFDDYLSCNIQETLKQEPIKVADFLKQISNDYKEELEEKNIKLLIQNDAIDESMSVDIAKMKRVFSNIISNSVRFIEKKGKISIFCKKVERYLEFTIRDNGTGVPKKDLNKIFEPLFTSDSSRKISGLGLSICKEIIESHGGYIYARNNKENGLDIIFTIQLH